MPCDPGSAPGEEYRAIGENDEGRFFTRQTLLDHHPVARTFQGLTEHEVFHGVFRRHVVMGNHHSLPRCQSVRLHNHRKRESGQGFNGLFKTFNRLEPRGGNSIPPHEFLGKDLTALQAGSRLAGADDGQPLLLELIDDACYQRRFRPNNRKVRAQLLRQSHDGLGLRKVYGKAFRFLRDAGISGGTIQLLHLLAFMQLPCQSVFPTTRPEYEYLHRKAVHYSH